MRYPARLYDALALRASALRTRAVVSAKNLYTHDKSLNPPENLTVGTYRVFTYLRLWTKRIGWVAVEKTGGTVGIVGVGGEGVPGVAYICLGTLKGAGLFGRVSGCPARVRFGVLFNKDSASLHTLTWQLREVSPTWQISGR
jgi:hypothetical protein